MKVRHRRSSGLAQDIEIPIWKWEKVNMDLILGLTKTRKQFESIWAIVDRLMKTTHFFSGKTFYGTEDYSRVSIQELVSFHGVASFITLDHDIQFSFHFLKSFHKVLGTMVKLSITFHPQIDEQAKRTIWILEDMLRAYALHFKGCWDDHLPLFESTYNNSFNSSIVMAPFKALYGRWDRSPEGWFKFWKMPLIGLDLVLDDMEKVMVIRERLMAGQSYLKSYANVRIRDLKFHEGYWVHLKVSPMKSIMHYEKNSNWELDLLDLTRL